MDAEVFYRITDNSEMMRIILINRLNKNFLREVRQPHTERGREREKRKKEGIE